MKHHILTIVLCFVCSLLLGQFVSKTTSPSSTVDKHLLTLKKTNEISETRTCFTVESEERLSKKYPNRLSQDAFEEKLAAKIKKSSHSRNTNSFYQIPTIVHIIHSGEPVGTGSNISTEQVMSQFDVLNEDFRRIGGGFNEHPDGADINIEFVPALLDPQGNSLKEPGIDRQFGYDSYYDWETIEFELKPNTFWDPNQYFNIWVLTFGGSATGLLGYAQFPELSGLDGIPEGGFEFTDGIVIGHKYFGRTGSVEAPFHLGRTTTHEVGHWLGLRHIWGDGDCGVDDYCADTPNANGPNRSCDFRDSCPGEGPDMIENYMDYSADACMNIFTNDQKARMRTVLEVSPRRNSLIACQQAPSANIGLNTTEVQRTWYQYTASENQVVTASSIGETEVNTKVSFYKECNAFAVNKSDDEFGSLQSELSIRLEAGETIKILWEYDDYIPYNWNLTVSSESEGATCELAANASEGTNTLPLTTLNTYWYYFPTPNTKITVDGNGNEYKVYGNTCDQLKLLDAGNGVKTVINSSSTGGTYIAFETKGGNFDWSLSTDLLQSGETCETIMDASLGKNVIPYSPPFEYWYTYTMPFDGNMLIKSAEFDQGFTKVRVMEDCEHVVLAQTEGTQFELPGISLKTGQTVFIMFDGETSSVDFEWYLDVQEYNNGEICSVAKQAQVGVNHTDAAPQWFKFTTTKRSNLRISAVDFTDVDTHLIIKDNCDGSILYSNDNDTYSGYNLQSQLVLYGIEPGKELYILWSEKWSYEGFDWIIDEMEPVAGDHCNNAKTALLGENTISQVDGHSYSDHLFWNKFTVPASGKKITVFADKPKDLAIYTSSNCNSFTYVDSDQGKAQAFNLTAGTQMIIIWLTDQIDDGFNFTISMDDIEPGDMCTRPIQAEIGSNESTTSPVWYEYTMSQQGSIAVNYDGPTNGIIPQVTLLDGCSNGDILYQGIGAGFISGLNKDERILIRWTTGYPFTGVKWTLEEITPKQGDTCTDPLVATYGLNRAEYATQWFTYTPETTGNVVISSRAFTYSNTNLYVYDGCDGDLLASSDDIFDFMDYVLYFQSEVFLENINAGQTLYIKWSGDYSFESFDWEITNGELRQGDTCEDPLQAVEGVNNGMKPTPAWFTFTMPRTASLTLSSLGHARSNTYVEVFDGCNGNLLAYNDDGFDSQSFVHIDELLEGQTVLIHWNNVAFSEKYTFDWSLFVGEPDPGLFCINPKVAQEGINTVPDFTSNYFWYAFTMPAANKKLVIKRLDVVDPLLIRNVGVTPDCELSSSYSIGEDIVEISGLAAGEEVRIFWGELNNGGRAGFNWELQVVDFGTGDLCEDPIEVLPGIHQASGYPTWYKYTMPKDGDIRLSSRDLNFHWVDTYVEVYDECNGVLIASHDNINGVINTQSELLLENVDAGQTFLIKWYTVHPFQSELFWKLSLESTDNTAPSLPDVLFYLGPNLTNGKIIGTLAAQDADGDALLYSIISGNEDGAFTLEAETGKLKILDADKINFSGEVLQLNVGVTDKVEWTYATVTLDLITSVIDDQPRNIVVYPNPAQDYIYLHGNDQTAFDAIFMTNMNGQVIKTYNADQQSFVINDLRSGIYFLNLLTSGKRYVLKVAIVR